MQPTQTLGSPPSAEDKCRAARGREKAVESFIGAALIVLALVMPDEALTLMLMCLGIPAAVIFGHMACAQLPRGKYPRRWLMAYAGIALGDFCIGLLLLTFVVLRPSGVVDSAGPREKARRINCSSNLKQIHLACRTYAEDNGGVLPPDFATLAAQKYLDVYKTYTCPSTRTEFTRSAAELSGPAHCDYRYFGGGQERREVGRYAVLACDRDGNHEGYYNVVFVNGTLANFRGATWYDVVRANHLRVPPARPQCD